MDNLMVIILAAGKGTRMKSKNNKMIHKLAGKSLINHVVDKALQLSDEVICVVGHQAQQVKNVVDQEKVNFVQQNKQLGTGHAVWQARDYLQAHEGDCLVLYGDTPLITVDTLEKLVQNHKNTQAGMSLLTARISDPAGYGRIVRDKNNIITGIVEEDDADANTAQIKEVNAGVYTFAGELLLEALKQVDNDNEQEEYYLTDTLEYISQKTQLSAHRAAAKEIVGINDREDLAEAERAIQKRINKQHMENGVTLIDPKSTYIETEVEIERDVTIYPGTVIKKGSKIAENCYIGPNCQLQDARLAENVQVKQGSYIIESEIAAGSQIGPYAHVRPGSVVRKNCKIGNFVELKKTRVDRGSKIPHLSYVGDGVIGSGCNIGAGTIFANYDGENKHKTILGERVFIGSNTTLVAPVELGDDSCTGAGSVVTKDVENNSIVMGVPARFYKKNK